MRFLFLFTCALFTFSGFSQDTLMKQRTRKLVSINYFRLNNITLTKQDSLSMVFIDGDTLVPVEKIAYEASNQVKVPYEPKDEEFLEVYRQAVFGNIEEQKEKSTIKIWKGGIRLFFDPSVPETHKKELLHFADEVSSGIDSLQITEVQERAKSNFVVFYRHSEEDYDQEERISNNNRAGYYVSWNGKQQIKRGVIKVNAYQIPQERFQLNLLKYHFFKSLGYFYSSTGIPCKSYLSACPVKRTLTPQDLEILKYHYSYGMCKGIDLESFNKIHADFKEILEKHPDSQLYLVHSN